LFYDIFSRRRRLIGMLVFSKSSDDLCGCTYITHSMPLICCIVCFITIFKISYGNYLSSDSFI
jgi:hypothetical protein